MGAPAVDLPDPLDENAIPAGGAAGSDDLLSQLASDEIDRLLAEDGDESTPAGSAAQPSGGDQSISESSPPAAVDDEATAPSTTAAAPQAAPQDDQTADDFSAASSPPDALNVADLDATLAAAVNLKSNDPDEPGFSQDQVHSAAGPAALHEPDDFDDAAARAMLTAADPSDDNADDDALFDADDTPAPLLLRPLVWLNAPLDLLPDPLRNAVSKVALITLFNALGVLTYVLIFRHH